MKIEKLCYSCQYYHGKKYGKTFLVCGIHPSGQENCADYQKGLSSLEIILLWFKFFGLSYLTALVLLSLLLPLLEISRQCYDLLLTRLPVIKNYPTLAAFLITIIILVTFTGEYWLIHKYLKQLNKRILNQVNAKYSSDRIEQLWWVSSVSFVLGLMTIFEIDKRYFLS